MLAPFRDCLTRHGVAPIPSGTDARQAWLQRQRQLSPAQERAQIRARIACIPALPPRLRAGAEKLKRRYERRNS
jgi:hypothetical protein